MSMICCCKEPYNNFKECDIHNPRNLEAAKLTLAALHEEKEHFRKEFEREREAHSRSNSEHACDHF